MPETPVSLLDRLRLRPDDGDWKRLVELYTPWIRSWPKRHSLPVSDVEDLVQETMAILVRELPDFRHDLRRGAFRRWVRHIVLNRLRTYWRTRGRRRGKTIDDADRSISLKGGSEWTFESSIDATEFARP